jgi:preprotein translocase subunit SecG
MSTFLTALHVIVCVFMIAVILLQRGKGAEIGAVFGSGASSTVFGSRGAGNFLTKLTTASAIIFMITSLSLSYLATSASEDRLFGDEAPEEPIAEESLFEELGTTPAEAESGFEEVGVAPAQEESEAAAQEPAADPAGERAP